MTDQHKHCPICQKPIPLSERVCSPKCEQIYMENQRKIAKSRKMLYIAFAAFIVVLIVVTFRSKIGF